MTSLVSFYLSSLPATFLLHWGSFLQRPCNPLVPVLPTARLPAGGPALFWPLGSTWPGHLPCQPLAPLLKPWVSPWPPKSSGLFLDVPRILGNTNAGRMVSKGDPTRELRRSHGTAGVKSKNWRTGEGQSQQSQQLREDSLSRREILAGVASLTHRWPDFRSHHLEVP